METRYKAYSAFFDFYLSEHSLPLTRALHYMASVCGISTMAVTVVTGVLWWIPVGVFASYGFAWVGHFFVEHNKPATFKYPLWSFVADYHMFLLFLIGGLGKRRARAARAMGAGVP